MESEIKRQVMICPHYKEPCVNGHTKSMGEDANGTPHICRFWIHVSGKDPQSTKQLDWFDCATSWLPVLLIENAQMIRQNTASVDKTANIFYEALPADVRERVALTYTVTPANNLLEETTK